jgi:hemolysin D
MNSNESPMASVAPLRHPALELLSHYRAVLRASWQVRHELSGPARMADEIAFLPAALSLQDTPPHPSPRRAIYVILALFVIALAWSILGQVDIVSVAHGRVVVSDRTKLIQPLENSVVKAIHVKDGDKVTAGQLLIELDATAPNADHSRLSQERATAQAERLRTSALIQAMDTGKAPQLPKGAAAELTEGEAMQAQAQLQAEWADIGAKAAKLQADIQHRQAEIATVHEQITKLQTTLPIVRQREQDFLALSKEGYVAGHAGQDKTRERIEQERDLATLQARLQETKAALVESQSAQTAFRTDTVKTLRERLSQAELKRSEASQEGNKAQQRQALTQLTAPTAGTVQQLSVHTAGGVVTQAQVLMVIVPDHPEVTAEIQLDNQDYGFVNVGQDAEVKFEAFPYTSYGTVHATVTVLAADAVTRDAQSAAQNAHAADANPNAAQTNAAGAYFPATLKLKQATMLVEGKQVRLSPGLALTAEIKTGKRRVIEYLLSPVQRYASESMRER